MKKIPDLRPIDDSVAGNGEVCVAADGPDAEANRLDVVVGDRHVRAVLDEEEAPPAMWPSWRETLSANTTCRVDARFHPIS